MTKKELERRYHYLLLEMKIINEMISAEVLYHDEHKLWGTIGAIQHMTKDKTIGSGFYYIEHLNAEYNFYHKTMNIDDYLEEIKRAGE